MAADLGFTAALISGATATYDRIGPNGRLYNADDIRNGHLASLRGKFCIVRTTVEVLKEMA